MWNWFRRRRSVSVSKAGEDAVARPDLLDLIGENYDRPPGRPARRTFIICSAPRTGSYELCRFLTAAGLGVPHEYFHPLFAGLLASRWSSQTDPLAEDHIGGYIDALRRRRSANGLFATKLQFWQFESFLRNAHGAALFEGATVVHLYRSDVAAQFRSYRTSMMTGRWDFSLRTASPPRPDSEPEAIDVLERLISEDAGLRRILALMGINPMFFTLEDIARRPRDVVRAIADALKMPVDQAALDRMLAASAAYPREHAKEPADFSHAFRQRAFSKP